MSFLDQLLAGVKNCAIAGTVISVTGAAPTINFVSGATGVYNAGTKSYDITITAGGGGTVSGVDVAGSDNAHVYVGSISGVAGAGGTVQLHISLLQFDSNQTSAGIAHAAPTGIGITPASLILTPQPAYSGANTSGTKTPGSLIVALANPVSGGNYPAFVVEQSGTPFFRVDNGTVSAGFTAMWAGSAASAPTNANEFFAYTDSGGMDMLYPSTGAYVGWQNDGSIQFVTAGSASLYAGISSSTTGVFRVATNYLTPGSVVFEAGFVGSTGRHVTALNQVGSGITTTQMPTGSGDGVTYIGNRQVRPTVSPRQGAVLFAESGQLWVMPGDGSNTAFQIAAGGGGGGVVSGIDVAGASNAAVYVVSLSGAGGSTAAIPLRPGAYISVTDGQPIIGDGTTTFLQTNGSGGLILNAASAQSLSLWVGGSQIAHLQSTGLVLQTSMFMLVSNNQDIIRDTSGVVLATDSLNRVLLGDATNSPAVHMLASTEAEVVIGANVIAQFTATTVVLNQPLQFFNQTTATSASAGVHGDVPAQVLGYLQVFLNSGSVNIPYYGV